MEEEETFWMMCCIIEDLLPVSYYSSTLIGAQVCSHSNRWGVGVCNGMSFFSCSQLRSKCFYTTGHFG